jgi:hypothetical protein
MITRFIGSILLIFYLLTISVFGNSSGKFTSEEELLLQYKNEITKAAKQVGMSPRIIASIIYAEHKLNVKTGENILDYVFAKSGYNSSMGIAQVKINTAFWIEEQIHNAQNQFYLGEEIRNKVPLSKNREVLIDKLDNPKTNILYASCYIAMINKLWEPVLELINSGKNKVGIIATIYSLGIFDSNNKARSPHIDAKMNNFGKTAQEFYSSFSLRNEFN